MLIMMSPELMYDEVRTDGTSSPTSSYQPAYL